MRTGQDSRADQTKSHLETGLGAVVYNALLPLKYYTLSGVPPILKKAQPQTTSFTSAKPHSVYQMPKLSGSLSVPLLIWVDDTKPESFPYQTQLRQRAKILDVKIIELYSTSRAIDWIDENLGMSGYKITAELLRFSQSE